MVRREGERGGFGVRLGIILGPAICQVCRQHVYLNEHRRWVDADGFEHRCRRRKAA